MRLKELLSQESGSAMVISLMALVLLTMLGSALLMQTNTETQLAAHDMRSTQALYNAEAGYAEILGRMDDDADTTNYIGQPIGQETPGWGAYLVLATGNSQGDPDHVRAATDFLDNNGNGLVDENGETYSEFLTKQDGSDDINYPWVFVEYELDPANQIMRFGDHDNDLSTPPALNPWKGLPALRIVAQGGQGSAERTLEVMAVRNPNPPIPASAVYTEATNFTFNGTQFLISGVDYDPVTGAPIFGNPEVPGMSTTSDPSVAEAELDSGSAQDNNIEGDGGEPSIEQSTVDLDLAAMAAEFIPDATISVTPGTYSNTNWGDYDNYEIVHCTGDLSLSGGSSGAGVLIVDGDLKISGKHSWTGLTIVLGDVSFSGGGENVALYGAILVGGALDISGNATIKYSSEALNKIYAISPYMVMNWREL